MQRTITPNTLHSFCRTCLSELQQPTMYNIQKMDVQIRIWLQDTTIQSPVTDDDYPTFVCHLCRNKLEYILEFHQICSRSRKVFQDILAKTCNSEGNDKSSSAWDSNDTDVNDKHGNEDGVEVNCDWLDFDFTAISKSMAELQRKIYKPGVTAKDELITTQSHRQQISSKRKDSVDSYSSSDEDDECSRLQDNNVKSNDNQEEDTNLSNDDPPTKSIDRQGDELTNLRKNQIKSPKARPKSMKNLTSKRKRNSTNEHSHTQHVCEECGKVFEKLKQLEKHQYSHRPPEEHPFYCSDCHKLYKSQQTFKEHQLRHSGIKNFECPYCGVKKTTKNELQTHLNYHTKERQYLCPNCPMIFSRISNFRRHDEVVHQGIRRYICRYCDQAFGKPNTLKHHEMIHTGEKPHECSECGKRFRQQVQLTTHMRVHTKQLNQQKINPSLLQKGFDVN